MLLIFEGPPSGPEIPSSNPAIGHVSAKRGPAARSVHIRQERIVARIAEHLLRVIAGIDDLHIRHPAVLLHEFDLDAIREFRLSWGNFRDRRPEMYQTISGKIGAE